MFSMRADRNAHVKEHTERARCEHCSVRHLTVVYPVTMCRYHGRHAKFPYCLRQMCAS